VRANISPMQISTNLVQWLRLAGWEEWALLLAVCSPAFVLIAYKAIKTYKTPQAALKVPSQEIAEAVGAAGELIGCLVLALFRFAFWVLAAGFTLFCVYLVFRAFVVWFL